MFTRVILETSQWKVSASAFGLGAITASNRSGEVVTATPEEKQYFKRLLSALSAAGVPINASSSIAETVVNDFAKVVHQRWRRTEGSAGFSYALFFSTYSPEEAARHYIDKTHGT